MDLKVLDFFSLDMDFHFLIGLALDNPEVSGNNLAKIRLNSLFFLAKKSPETSSSSSESTNLGGLLVAACGIISTH